MNRSVSIQVVYYILNFVSPAALASSDLSKLSSVLVLRSLWSAPAVSVSHCCHSRKIPARRRGNHPSSNHIHSLLQTFLKFKFIFHMHEIVQNLFYRLINNFISKIYLIKNINKTIWTVYIIIGYNDKITY